MPSCFGLVLTANARSIPSDVTKRLQFHWKTVTAKAEYGRQLRGYRFFNALRKHPFFHFGKFGLVSKARCWSKVLS